MNPYPFSWSRFSQAVLAFVFTFLVCWFSVPIVRDVVHLLRDWLR